MIRYLVASTVFLGFVLPAALAAPPQRAPAVQQDVIAPATTISNEAYIPSETIKANEIPECQIKLGTEWAPTVRTPTLESCADQLDKVAPKDSKNMTTAYWNNLYLAADAKTIYKADAKSDWSVMRARKAY